VGRKEIQQRGSPISARKSLPKLLLFTSLSRSFRIHQPFIHCVVVTNIDAVVPYSSAIHSTMSWICPPHAQHAWSLDEIKLGNIINTYSLNEIITNNDGHCGVVVFGRIADDPSLVDIVTAHESCSRRHARIAFDRNGTPWLRDLGSGNGTFVNERRIPPEACGKEESIDGKQKGSRGVVLYPGDALRFGASTRIFVLDGPEEYERDAIGLKRRIKSSTVAAIATHSNVTTSITEEKELMLNNDAGCSWGMADNLSTVVIDQEEQSVRVDAASLPSMDSFFSSQKYKISDPLYKLHSQYNTKIHKLQSIQLESQRILQKENMGVELTDGQRGQLAKNGERIATLEKEVANLTNRIEDGMYKIIHGKDRGSITVAKKDLYHAANDADVDDDFFDRTANKHQSDGDEAESEMSLIQKWKSLLDNQAKQELVVIRSQEHCERIQKQINEIADDDEDYFFLQNELALANDNLSKAAKCIDSTAKELDNVEYLLKIVNAKLVWDRREGRIGTNIMKKVDISMEGFDDQETQQNDIDDMEDDSLKMPPPPPCPVVLSPDKTDLVYQDKVESMMPPPVKVDTEPLHKKLRVIGPMKPPPQPGNDQSMSDCATEPQRKKIQLRPVTGTLAALRQRTLAP
jgi:pSer/pThr/pTyr-binding forkhead associated (FHA) protein